LLIKEAYPTYTTSALASARLVDMPVGTVMRSGEITITQKDLDAEIGKSPLEMRTQLKRNLLFVLENKATNMFLQYEAGEWAKKNKTAADQGDPLKPYLLSLADGITASDEDTKAFFDSNKDMMGDAGFDQVKDQIKEHLVAQKRENIVNAHIGAIGERYQIDINKTWAAKQHSAAMGNPIDKARKSGKPTMVDLGADGCRPCEMMTPILESLTKEYAGRVNIVFVHVRKEQILAARYGVQSIPVQIFFDKDGKEVFRHVGFFPKDRITAKLAEMGVK
jgi:thioredoxin 1